MVLWRRNASTGLLVVIEFVFSRHSNLGGPTPGMPKYVTIPTVGDTVNDEYVLGEVIGEGAFGKVYEARQLGLDRRVAVKILHPRIATHEQLIEDRLGESVCRAFASCDVDGLAARERPLLNPRLDQGGQPAKPRALAA